MQIHEIFRRNTNENVLKNVRTLPPRNDRGRFMPRAATAAFNQMATQLQNQPAAPASLPTATTPAPGTTPAYGQRLSGYGQQTYNVPTGAPLPAQAAPAAKPAAPAPAADTTTPTQPWQPVNPNVKPGGSKEAQAFRTQQAAQKQAAQKQADASTTAKTTTPGKAGFMRNAAEYFANKTLKAAGIPDSMQGQYHPGGHIAASMGQGTTAIEQSEHKIAYDLAQEYVNQGTLNRNPTQLTPAAITSAAQLVNQAGQRLQLNFDNIVQLTQQYTKKIKQQKDQAQQIQAQNQMRINQLMDQLEAAERQQNMQLVQQIADELRQRGVSNKDIQNLRSSVANDVQSNLTTTANKMLSSQTKPTSSVAPVPTNQLRGNKPGAPTQQDYENLEKKLQQAMAAQGQTA